MYISRYHRLYLPINEIILSMVIVFVFANSVDPDEMTHFAVLRMGIHCFPE